MSTFLVIGQSYWGAGENLVRAKKYFTVNGGDIAAGGYEIIEFDDETEFKGVDEMGRFHYVGNSPKRTEVPPTTK